MLIEAFIRDANIPGAYLSYWVLDPSKQTEVITKTLPIVNVCGIAILQFSNLAQIDPVYPCRCYSYLAAVCCMGE